MNINEIIAKELGVQVWQVEAVIALLDEGCTIPFIARYRKEKHGEMSDQQLRDLTERLGQLRAVEERREAIVESLRKQEKWTEELQADLDRCQTLAQLEDVYRPYKPKRRTRASVAREKGLEPLADLMLLQLSRAWTIEELAQPYIDPEKGVADAEEAISGAMDIIAERVSDDAKVRTRLKNLYTRECQVRTAASAEDANTVYQMYFDRSEPLRTMPPHRVLAVNRGEKEGALKVSLDVPEADALREVRSEYVLRTGSVTCEYVEKACDDAYDRLIAPSLANELRGDLTDKAQQAAIRVFALNLKPLLMQPPIRGRVVLGLDPGFAHGCKLAVVDPTGRVLDTGVIYPTQSARMIAEAKLVVKRLIVKHHVTAAAIGNGTASRETERFFAEVMKEMNLGAELQYMIVSEAGASVYSASKLATEEFPQYDVNVRSAISIARRMQDPLAELVKIDPKAIGVGQYQHDLKEKELDEALDGVVEDCVNAVGVDVNTASASLLEHVAGISASLAKSIVAYREENGGFKTRSELKKVPKLGPKAFAQCAGFLRIPGGKDLIENTGVHPESYAVAKALLKRFDMKPGDAAGGKLVAEAEKVGYAALAKELDCGEPTLRDIVKELNKPGRDPRDELPPPLLRADVLSMDDLKPGLELKGTVRNVTDFGAFVDIGVHRDGLVHISQLGRFVRHPSEMVRTGDTVTVWVLNVEKDKQRISLTMKKPQ
ncbi:MAG: RNA-binding transcriptional accessory protein [Clostridia bacterium]|nr:RNA-binding transcriptional accessory protein [Clostridia bacterium]